MKKRLIKKTGATSIKRGKIKLPKRGYQRPDFNSLTEFDLETPFDVDADSLGLQGDADEEVSAALQSVIDEKKERADMYRVTNDQDYYFLVCFQSEQQKKDFLDKVGWNLGERFLNGLKLAEILGVDVPRIDMPMRDYSKNMPVRLRAKEVIR